MLTELSYRPQLSPREESSLLDLPPLDKTSPSTHLILLAFLLVTFLLRVGIAARFPSG
jgi:hypothetical protein